MSFVVTQALAAAETKTPLTEWPEKILTSKPTNFRTSHNQRVRAQGYEKRRKRNTGPIILLV